MWLPLVVGKLNPIPNALQFRWYSHTKFCTGFEREEHFNPHESLRLAYLEANSIIPSGLTSEVRFVRLRCNLTRNPKYRISWQKRGEIVDSPKEVDDKLAYFQAIINLHDRTSSSWVPEVHGWDLDLAISTIIDVGISNWSKISMLIRMGQRNIEFKIPRFHNLVLSMFPLKYFKSTNLHLFAIVGDLFHLKITYNILLYCIMR